MNFDREVQETLTDIKKIKQNKGNFQTVKKYIGEERLIEFFNTIYPKFSLPEIQLITGIPDATLERWFQELDIPLVRAHIKNISIAGDKNEEVIIKKDITSYRINTIKITPELAYFIGFALGDGTIEKYMPEVFNQDKKLKEPLFNIMKEYGSITEDERNDGLWRLRLSSVVIANLIKDEKGIRKDTLNYIFDKDELARKFIAAFWDAEGTVRPQGKYYHIYLYNSNEYLINKVKEFLIRKEIKFSTHTRFDENRIYFLKGRQIKSKKPLHRISIPKIAYRNWINEIGIYLLHSKKNNVVKEMINFLGGK